MVSNISLATFGGSSIGNSQNFCFFSVCWSQVCGWVRVCVNYIRFGLLTSLHRVRVWGCCRCKCSAVGFLLKCFSHILSYRQNFTSNLVKKVKISMRLSMKWELVLFSSGLWHCTDLYVHTGFSKNCPCLYLQVQRAWYQIFQYFETKINVQN